MVTISQIKKRGPINGISKAKIPPIMENTT
jgi:hypothetical protein